MISSNFSRFLIGLEDAFKYGQIKSLEEKDALVKYLFAKQFGWTPRQVDELTYREVEIFLRLIEVEGREKEIQMSKMERRQWGV